MFRISFPILALVVTTCIGSSFTQAQEPSKAETPPPRKVEILTEDLIGVVDDTNQVLIENVDDPRKEGEKPTARYTVTTPDGTKVRTVYATDPFLLKPERPLLHHFGLTLAEADDALRSQLELPPGEGVVIVTVKPSGLAHDAGLQPNDVILSLRGTPAKNVAEVEKVLLALTKEAIPVKLIRNGKRTQLSVVGPEHGITAAATEFWIGVPVSPVDATLRTHLPTLSQEVGLVANDVVKQSPAEAAGLKKNDILVTIDGKPLKDVQGMIAVIQATGGKPVPVEILRAGKALTLTVTPAKRPASVTLGQANATPWQVKLYQNPPVFGLSSNWSQLSEKDRETIQRELQQQPGPDGKIEVTHLLSGAKFRVDAASVKDLSASPKATVRSAASRSGQIANLTSNNEGPVSPSQVAKLESQMKELSTKLDEIRGLLDGLKNTEKK